MSDLTIHLGVKSDPILYRYSYAWLFRLMAEEGVHHLQLGTFFELYQLPDAFFTRLRDQARDFGIAISSVFTAHRELGGFFQDDTAWQAVARRNFERLIEIGGLVGASAVGSNPGTVPRDLAGTKPAGLERYREAFQEMLTFAHAHGVERLTIEPMSCLAEPPTTSEEIRALARDLTEYRAGRVGIADFGFCVDVAHGFTDADQRVVEDHWSLMTAALPWTTELHLKNTDAAYSATLGFGETDRQRGVVDAAAVRRFYDTQAAMLPVQTLVGYLETGGPKLGRDSSDTRLDEHLRASLRHLASAWLAPVAKPAETPVIAINNASEPTPVAVRSLRASVRIAPSVMCADLNHLEESVRRLERARLDILHLDVMDARFTPNLPLGLETIRQLRPLTSLPFDVHLMVENNDFFVRQAAAVGADWVSVHVESCPHLDRTLALARELGMKAGAALNPATPPTALEYVLDRLDFVLLMTVNPGFAGQTMVPGGLRKIADTRAWLDAHGCGHLPIEVDGNVSLANIPGMVAAGADVLVAGSSSVFAPGRLADNVAATRAAIGRGLANRAPTSKEFAA